MHQHANTSECAPGAGVIDDLQLQQGCSFHGMAWHIEVGMYIYVPNLARPVAMVDHEASCIYQSMIQSLQPLPVCPPCPFIDKKFMFQHYMYRATAMLPV